MSLLILVISLVLLAVPLLIFSLRVLSRLPVLRPFLLGTTALFAGILAVAALLSAWDLYSYRALASEHPVAHIRFIQRGPQQFEAQLRTGEREQHFRLYGDQWQLDARVIKWHTNIARLGLAPLFRLERLSGRYQSVADEYDKPRSVHAIAASESVDVWHWLELSEPFLALADAQYGSAAYLPMADRASFEVRIGLSGLVARPTNEAALKAVGHWASDS